MPAPFDTATLVLQGPGGKVRCDIAGERTTLGRTRDNDIVVQDPAVSSHHCEFVVERGLLVLRDLGSSNGTWVNGRRVQSGPVYDGDAVRVGQHQGRITVQRADGKPLRAPGGGATLAIAAGVAVLLVAGAVAAWYLLVKKPANEDRALFAEYEKHAKTALELEPCGAIEESVRRLRGIDTSLEPLTFGKSGKLSKPEVERSARILERLRAKEPLMEESGSKVRAVLEQQKAAIAQLRGYGPRFHAEEMGRTTKALEAIFAERLHGAEELADKWSRLATQVAAYNALLDRVIKSGDRRQADQLDSMRPKIEPAKLLAQCQSAFVKTQQDGHLKLAETEY